MTPRLEFTFVVVDDPFEDELHWAVSRTLLGDHIELIDAGYCPHDADDLAAYRAFQALRLYLRQRRRDAERAREGTQQQQRRLRRPRRR